MGTPGDEEVRVGLRAELHEKHGGVLFVLMFESRSRVEMNMRTSLSY